MKPRHALAAAAILVAGMAFAHSENEATTPPDGATVSGAPEMIELVFDMPVRVTLARLLNAEGAEMPLERETGMAPSLQFRAVPDTLPPGAYRVEWRGLAADGHPMGGAFSFTVE